MDDDAVATVVEEEVDVDDTAVFRNSDKLLRISLFVLVGVVVLDGVDVLRNVDIFFRPVTTEFFMVVFMVDAEEEVATVVSSRTSGVPPLP